MKTKWISGSVLIILLVTSCGNDVAANTAPQPVSVPATQQANHPGSNLAVPSTTSEPAWVSVQNSTTGAVPPTSPSTSTQAPATTSHPAITKGRVVVLDAGHGGADSGAIGIGGIMEKNLTLSYALAVQKTLQARGYQVYLTRATDTAVDPTTTNVEQEIRSRTALAKQHHASVYVSIHMNWYSNSSANGTETFYNNTNRREGLENPYPEQSILLAKTLEAYVTSAIHTANRGSHDDELYNLITNTVPASLIEVGFISNQSDLDKILDPNVQSAFANAFADAMDAYFAKLT